MVGDNVCTIDALCDNIVAVSFVAKDELDICEVAFCIVVIGVTELLQKVDTVGVDVAIIIEGVIVIGVAALPGQSNIIGVSFITEDRFLIDGAGVVDYQIALGVAGGNTACRIDALCAVHFAQTACSHGNRHGRIFTVFAVGDGELAVCFRPCGDLLRQLCIGAERNGNVAFVVGDAFGESVNEGVGAQIRSA